MESTPRTTGDLIGFNDTEHFESDGESIDVTDIQPNVNLFPATVEGIRKRFYKLYTEFTRQGKHEHRNELVFLLKELLRQQGIGSKEYTILNNILAKSLGSRIADEEANVEGDSFEKDKREDEKIKRLIQSTIEYSIQHDEKEMLDLMNEFRKDVGEDDDFLDTVLELEELMDVFLFGESSNLNNID